jgi:hypothetical protein
MNANDMKQPEPNEFGNKTTDCRHFTNFSLRQITGDKGAKIDNDLQTAVNMMNPMYFIQQNSSNCVQYWFIRSGTKDTDTAHTIFGNLAAILENKGKNVNASLYWDGGHGVNQDPEAFVAWVRQITNYSMVVRASPSASAFSSVTVFRGWAWCFFVHSSGGVGAHTYQWYEGTTIMQGQTSMVLSVSRPVAGTYTYFCQVTDSDGASANSNTITLTVLQA